MKYPILSLIGFIVLVLTIPGTTIEITNAQEPYIQTIRTTASWYGIESCVEKECLMANGEKFDENKITCASRQFYGRTLKIEYQGKIIECLVTDKISKTYDNIRIDLSKKAFEILENLDKGLITITIY